MAGLSRPSEVLSGDLEFITAYTLVDITDTGNNNPKGMTLEYKQAQNLNTLIQVLSLRTQLVLSGTHMYESQDLTQYEFGTNYSGTHTVWTFRFASEQPEIWKRESNPVYYAERDTNLVPIHTNLNETSSISNFFDTVNTGTKNIYFTVSEIL